MKRLPEWAQDMLERSFRGHTSEYGAIIQREAGGNASVAEFAGSLVEEVERLRAICRQVRDTSRLVEGDRPSVLISYVAWKAAAAAAGGGE